jgi:diguanylate cyclase (GGDEF)-like protein
MVRTCGVLFSSGAVLTLAGVLLPHSSEADLTGFWLIAGVAAAIGTLLLAAGRRTPVSVTHACMLLASLLIGLSLYFNGERHGGASAGNEVLFVWVALFAGYYFTRPAMVLQLAGIAAIDGCVLSAIHAGDVGYTRWLITVFMVSLAGVVVFRLRRHNEQLVVRLVERGQTDELTALPNRRGFDERLDEATARSARSGNPLALVMCDLDGLKPLNDTRGHAAGDRALAAVGEAARAVTRRGDVFARIGGDEFAAILPGAGHDGALAFAERLRASLRSIGADDDRSLSMSFGIAVHPQPCGSQALLFAQADAALYAAKRAGGDRALVAHDTASLTAPAAGSTAASQLAGIEAERPGASLATRPRHSFVSP